ncbi:MAG: hypothetical protein JSR77_01985 [Planctomycetes bacterium]|nr:hypothetical protein [Planctomycetota bacterium]
MPQDAPTTHGPSRFWVAAWSWPPCLIALALRVLVIGRPPFTDDGWYTSIAWFAHEGLEPAIHSPVTAYPRLLSWVFSVTDRPLLWLRAIDGIIAVLVALVVFKLLRTLVPRRAACVMASLFTLLVNQPKFIDAGFKNQINAATLLLALSLIAAFKPRTRDWPIVSGALAGAFVAGAVLLREAFVPFALVAAAACWMRHGWRGACAFAATAGTSALAGLSLIAHGPGRIGELLAQWRESATALTNLAAVMKRDWTAVWVDSGTQAFAAGGWGLVFVALGAAAGLAGTWSWLRSGTIGAGRAVSARGIAPVVGLGLLLAPAPEMLAKLAFPYHFAQFALGAVVLCACLHRRMNVASRRIVWTIAALIATYPMFTSARYAMEPWRESRRWWPVMVQSAHDAPLIRDSFYLRLTDALRRAAKPGDRVLCSGFYFGPLALARVHPVRGDAADASFLTCLPEGGTRTQAARAIAQAMPRIVVESSRIKTDFTEFVPGFPNGYTLFERIEPGTYSSYSPYDARVWVRD